MKCALLLLISLLIVSTRDLPAQGLQNGLLEEPLEWKPGWIAVPERPGLGIRFDQKELRKVMAS